MVPLFLPRSLGPSSSPPCSASVHFIKSLMGLKIIPWEMESVSPFCLELGLLGLWFTHLNMTPNHLEGSSDHRLKVSDSRSG